MLLESPATVLSVPRNIELISNMLVVTSMIDTELYIQHGKRIKYFIFQLRCNIIIILKWWG
jgi:hypothetical protein